MINVTDYGSFGPDESAETNSATLSAAIAASRTTGDPDLHLPATNGPCPVNV